ncbi:hypothetical protein OG2516_05038 [Oceanicola granulosus HTCC2516]|uniref:Ribosomal RNA large subunit methyltransferase J n=1 Tax=Oceanicola granulosus (strain ATCC BAA-861 / DSM 15982 / KCTC 12143 / HTCC2516) TaxID=314256 RepID=Q2CBY0_OCEGH|nr:23S rRNA (adenine(2030)-N(6))-methyltransferase RlmJ [Oceanicola granulosus]EAR50214.1 hypothetical protein OG2516_05038 [Oceanicola granulosus HTCC2516]
MLSYQHAYHAGNMADVHKHAVLATALAYMTAKPKPITYIETHAGRGLYRLDGAEAAKTGEAAQGIARREADFPPGHPYRDCLDAVRAAHGATAYPGSPLIAETLLRVGDVLHLAELHPREHAALDALLGRRARVHRRDGAELALSLCPPDPRRGLMLIDPSWEVKDEWAEMPRLLARLHRVWPVGVLMLWYPRLVSGAHLSMVRDVRARLPEARLHEIGFPPARPGHGMIGSGLVLVNPPWGVEDELARLSALFPTSASGPS